MQVDFVALSPGATPDRIPVTMQTASVKSRTGPLMPISSEGG